MNASLLVNNTAIPLDNFTRDYIANVLRAIAYSLRIDSTDVTICIKPNELHIYTEKGEVGLIKDFAKQLIENTIKGMLSPLKGVFWLKIITITSMESIEGATSAGYQIEV